MKQLISFWIDIGYGEIVNKISHRNLPATTILLVLLHLILVASILCAGTVWGTLFLFISAIFLFWNLCLEPSFGILSKKMEEMENRAEQAGKKTYLRIHVPVILAILTTVAFVAIIFMQQSQRTSNTTNSETTVRWEKAQKHFQNFLVSQEGDPEKAFKEIEAAIQLMPEQAQWYMERARFCKDMRLYDKALEDLNRTIQIAPQSSAAYGMRGEIYHIKKMYEQAVQNYEKAIQIDPSQESRLAPMIQKAKSGDKD